MDDLDLVIEGHKLSTSESIYSLGKEYYEAMFRENTLDMDRNYILQKRQEICPWNKEENNDWM